jgi:hypothetical protein
MGSYLPETSVYFRHDACHKHRCMSGVLYLWTAVMLYGISVHS